MRKLKYALQRVKRGWDDRATWSVCDWFVDHMLPIMEAFRADLHGVPFNLADTPEKYEKDLDDIIEGLKSARMFLDDTWATVDEKGKVVIDKKKRAELLKKYNKGMKLFCKHFFDLWD